MLRDKLALQGVHLHIIAPRPGESIDAAVFGTMAKCDAFLAMATKDYGADTGNTASTFHEVRTWKEKYETKPLIPLRMWGAEFEHETARALFSSNVLSLKWIKGEPTPSRLVDDILRGLGLERETEMQVRQRRSSLVTSPLGVGSRPSTGHATMGGGVK